MKISRRKFLTTSAACLLWTRRDCCHAGAVPPHGSPFLNENFAPVREEIAGDNLPVIGSLPAELNGMFIRNGPNPQFPPRLNYHWFDGDGMLHGVRLQDGKASYRNRWVRTAAWRAANQAGQAIYPSMLDPPDVKLLLAQFLKGEMPYPNTANTSLAWHHGKLLALWEGGPPHEIKVPSLETAGLYTFGGQLKHAFTAHPKVDPRTGELMFFGYSPLPPFVQYSVADRQGTIKSTTPIALPRAVMMHDMAITENYSVFIDCPAVFDPTAMVRGKPILSYEPQHGARIGVLPRHARGDEIKWFAIEPCFIFHLFGAYEEAAEIVLHGCRFPQYPEFVALNAPLRHGELGPRLQSFSPLAYAWRMDMKSGQTSEVALDDLSSEFPRINDEFAGRQTKYGYSVASAAGSATFLKYDFQSRTRERHELGKGQVAGEGVFVARPGATSEDDGWLLSFTHDRIQGRSELRVIDCQDLAGHPVARVQIPQRVPYGFHAIWLPDKVLAIS
jgi:carotenoid cleavage dioxygenase